MKLSAWLKMGNLIKRDRLKFGEAFQKEWLWKYNTNDKTNNDFNYNNFTYNDNTYNNFTFSLPTEAVFLFVSNPSIMSCEWPQQV
jgi:hypothetical protein